MRKPKKLMLILPHTSELPTTRPMMYALREKALKEGIQVEVQYSDMRQRIWNAAKKVKGHRYLVPPAVERAVDLEDHLIRLERLAAVHDPSEVLALEIHAYGKGYTGYNEPFKEIEGTDSGHGPVFIISNWEVLKSFRGVKRYPTYWNVREAAEMIGFDLEEALSRMSKLLIDLSGSLPQIALIEIPGHVKCFSKEHPMYNDFFEQSEIYPSIDEVLRPLDGWITIHGVKDFMPLFDPTPENIDLVFNRVLRCMI